ncbi:MAG: DUF4398 domain-containing protein [Myxococcales bacterium]|nr:DUF4398 domain-containing protein [Myxococcales bacterium]
MGSRFCAVWLASVSSLGLVSGCTASKASLQLVSAEQALLRAERFEAPTRAEYEYTMAVRYLEKAREEAGYSDFRIADALARKSAEWSDRAIIFVERGGKALLQFDDVTDDAAPPAPVEQPIAPTPEEPEDAFEVDEELELEVEEIELEPEPAAPEEESP